jgi:glycosyltransferase involved in cell wall biosynthesis
MLIAWAPYSRRSEMFSKILGGRLHCIHYLRFQSPLHAPLKYVLQAIRTLQVLFAERPQVVHVQNPPFVCGLVVYAYSRIRGTRFVFDHHSAAFAQTWRWALPIQRFLARRAITNIVTNTHWADIVSAWGAHALVMGDPFLELPPGEPFAVQSGFNVAFIGTFAPDEPLDAVVEAARQLPQVHIYITGNASRKPKSFFDGLPVNVTCTGFLPDAQYIGLLNAVDAVMVLTTRNHTLQLGGCEAVSAGQPLITSDWPYLQSFFPDGTIHVANTPEGIRTGVLMAQKEHGRLKEEMVRFREVGRQQWNIQVARLVERVAQVTHS